MTIKKIAIAKSICIVLFFLCMTCKSEKSQQLPDSFHSFVQTIKTAQLGGDNADIVIKSLDDNTVHIKISFDLPEEVQQDDWQVNIIPAFRPTFHWAPHLTPTDNHIIEQYVFRSPAMIFSDEKHILTLIPDLNILQKGSPVRWYMDMDAEKNVLTLGMSENNSKPTGRVAVSVRPIGLGKKFREIICTSNVLFPCFGLRKPCLNVTGQPKTGNTWNTDSERSMNC